METSSIGKCDVGGVLMERPFRIRRLGHFGLNVGDMGAALDFYTGLLGFRISDEIDFAEIVPHLRGRTDLGDARGYFTRMGTDHHSFVLFPKQVRQAMDKDRMLPGDVTINQITWQVGSLKEVADASRWLGERKAPIIREGRDTPGSNWHVYFMDPDRHVNELYYGIEQIGWNGLSKPREMYVRGFRSAPTLPQPSELTEVEEALRSGISLSGGHRSVDAGTPRFDVGGTMLPRPFKVTGIGPVHLFVRDVDEAFAFYEQELGLVLTETVSWEGHRCQYLRANTEHHSVGLFPSELRKVLGLSENSTCKSFGLRLNDYRQLKDAIQFLRAEGVTIRYLPPELSPGMDYCAFAIDPDGHALQLYFHMEQIGWDGLPRSPAQRRRIDNDRWPETVDATSDSFGGEVFPGPWG